MSATFSADSWRWTDSEKAQVWVRHFHCQPYWTCSFQHIYSRIYLVCILENDIRSSNSKRLSTIIERCFLQNNIQKIRTSKKSPYQNWSLYLVSANAFVLYLTIKHSLLAWLASVSNVMPITIVQHTGIAHLRYQQLDTDKKAGVYAHLQTPNSYMEAWSSWYSMNTLGILQVDL